MTRQSELNGFQKLEAVRVAMEAFGYDFNSLNVHTAFAMFRAIDTAMVETEADAFYEQIDWDTAIRR